MILLVFSAYLRYNEGMEKRDLTAVDGTENQTEIAALKARISELERLLKYYEEQLRISKHRQYGASSEKSEYDPAQLSIFNEAELLSDANVPEPELVEIAKHYRKRTRLTTDKLPEDLPVEVVEHDLPESEQVCPECGGELHVMGRDTRRELVIIPAQVKIREHVRKVYACRNCEKDECSVPIVKSPANEPVIKGSFASPEAIAYIMTQKFVIERRCTARSKNCSAMGSSFHARPCQTG